MKIPKTAFFVRNQFQVSHLAPLFRKIDNARWVVTRRRDIAAFGIERDDCDVVPLFLRRHLERFDIVVSHAAPPRGRPLRRAAFVMVQYGYAKAPYNFGPWRAQAQAILAYGPFAKRQFERHAPSYVIGNPRWDDWQPDQLKAVAQAALPALDTTKPVILYAPTWGALSSLPQWLGAIQDLARDHTVLVKAHHNSIRDGQLDFADVHPHVHDVSGHDLMQLLALCDIVVSDYSGAIFDGIMCKKPVVLLDVNDIEKQFGNKLDAKSIEMSRRDELGFRVQEKSDLCDTIYAALTQPSPVSGELDQDLFLRPKSVAQNFADLLPTLVR